MTAADGFRQRLTDGEVIVIDGGMGPELARRGVPMDEVAWAAPAVLEHADVVRQAHEDYIRAGAQAIITNTFMGGFFALEAAGLGDRAAEVNRRSAQIACEARANAGDDRVLVVGSLFPGSMVADLDTMMPKDLPDADTMRAAVKGQGEALLEGGADVLALEMPPTAEWSRLAIDALADLGAPLWLCPAYGHHVWPDGAEIVHPNDPPGQIGELVRLMLDGTRADVMVVNVMHTEMADVDHALDEVGAQWKGALGVYPHHGEHLLEAPGFRPLPVDPEAFVAGARHWIDRGVQVIGGCCGIGPEHIRALQGQLPTHIAAGARS